MFAKSTLPQTQTSAFFKPGVLVSTATTVGLLLGGAWVATADDSSPELTDPVELRNSAHAPTCAPMRVEQSLYGESATNPSARTSEFAAAPMTETRATYGRFGRTGRRLDLRAEPRSTPSLMMSQTAADLIGEIVRPTLASLPQAPTLTTGHPLLETSPQERVAIQQVLAGELDAAIVCGGLRPQDTARGLRTFELGFHIAVLTVTKQAGIRSVQRDQLRQLLVARDANWLAFGGGRDKAVLRRLSTSLTVRGPSMPDLMARLLVPGDALRCTPHSASTESVTITSLAEFQSDSQGRRLLAMDAVQPSLATARSGAYPAACPVHLVWHQGRAEMAHALREQLQAPAVAERLAATLTVR